MLKTPHPTARIRTALLVTVATAVLTVGQQIPASATLAPAPLRSIPTPFVSGHAGLYGWGAATMLDGSVLIGDYWNFRVVHYAADGTPLGDFYNNPGFGNDQTQSPYGMGVDPNTGDVYIADTDRYRIEKIDPSGQFMLAWGVQGSGPGKFLYPSRVAVDSAGKVFVVDSWDNNIVMDSVDDSTGVVTELGQFGAFGTGPGQFKAPHGAAFYYGAPGAADDKLFVVDANNKRIQVFDDNGAFLFQFGSAKSKGGQFTGDLRGLAIDQSSGLVYVVDAAGNNIDQFDVNGNYLLSFGKNGSGNGQFSDGGREVTVDGNHNVWVGDMPNFRAQVFSSNGVYLFQVPNPPQPPALGAFNAPRGVAIDKFNNIWVADTYNQRIEKFAPDGTFLLTFGSRGRDEYSFNYPRMIATDPRDGSVVIADTDNHSIKKYTNDGVFLWAVGSLGTTLGKFKNPHGVDVGPDGRIYVADSRNQRIQVLDENGTPLYTFGSNGTGNGQYKFPRGVAVDTDGTLWVSDSTRKWIQHVTATGSYLGRVGGPGTGVDKLLGPFDVEANGQYVFVVDSQLHCVKVYTDPGNVISNGTYVMTFGSRGSGPDQFISPDGLDLTSYGTILVGDEKNDRVDEWSLNIT